jgi:hypothetical protein
MHRGQVSRTPSCSDDRSLGHPSSSAPRQPTGPRPSAWLEFAPASGAHFCLAKAAPPPSRLRTRGNFLFSLPTCALSTPSAASRADNQGNASARRLQQGRRQIRQGARGSRVPLLCSRNLQQTISDAEARRGQQRASLLVRVPQNTQLGPFACRSGQVYSRPKTEAMRVTRQLGPPPRHRRI